MSTCALLGSQLTCTNNARSLAPSRSTPGLAHLVRLWLRLPITPEPPLPARDVPPPSRLPGEGESSNSTRLHMIFNPTPEIFPTNWSPDPARLFSVPDVEEEPLGVSSSALGAIAEHRAIAELLVRGFRVALPVVDDDGVDLVVNYRTTVQVKSCGGFDREKGRFRFHVRSGASIRQQYRGNVVRTGVRADVLLCHAVAEGLWWLVPAAAVEGRSNADVYPGGKLDAFRDNWGLLELNPCA